MNTRRGWLILAKCVVPWEGIRFCATHIIHFVFEKSDMGKVGWWEALVLPVFDTTYACRWELQIDLFVHTLVLFMIRWKECSGLNFGKCQGLCHLFEATISLSEPCCLHCFS